jgi:hypothetical protein
MTIFSAVNKYVTYEGRIRYPILIFVAIIKLIICNINIFTILLFQPNST